MRHVTHLYFNFSVFSKIFIKCFKNSISLSGPNRFSVCTYAPLTYSLCYYVFNTKTLACYLDRIESPWSRSSKISSDFKKCMASRIVIFQMDFFLDHCGAKARLLRARTTFGMLTSALSLHFLKYCRLRRFFWKMFFLWSLTRGNVFFLT